MAYVVITYAVGNRNTRAMSVSHGEHLLKSMTDNDLFANNTAAAF